MPRVRLYLDQPLAPGETAALARPQAHYLFNVMRLRVGAEVEVFDGRTGAYAARVAEDGRRGGTLEVRDRVVPLGLPPDVDLIFAPLKPARTAILIEKATELGVRRLRPVRTRYTNAPAWRAEKMAAHAVEAAEQCGATYVPPLAPLADLDAALAECEGRAVVFCDEGLAGRPPDGEAVTAAGARTDAPSGWAEVPPGPAALVVGPEGGFSAEERATLRRAGHAVTLGPRILRADTAAVAALTLWQSLRGDW